MSIPKEILAIERPKSTRVKKSGNRYLVIKRTSKYVQGRSVPVELGTIGEIIDGKYVEIRKEPRKKKRPNIDIPSLFPLPVPSLPSMSVIASPFARSFVISLSAKKSALMMAPGSIIHALSISLNSLLRFVYSVCFCGFFSVYCR